MPRRSPHPLQELPKAAAKAIDAVAGCEPGTAYGVAKGKDAIQFLFDLNQELAQMEAKGQAVGGPGLPDFVNDRAAFITTDRLLP